MTEEFEFIAAVIPSLIRLAESLFHANDKNAERTIIDITDRTAQVDALRQARDADLERKYPKT